MITTVIFDVGGTLVGAPDLFTGLSQCFSQPEAYGLLANAFMGEYHAVREGRKPFSTIQAMIEKTMRAVSVELGCADMSPCAGRIYYDNWVTKSYLYEDTISTLERLKRRGIRLVIASDADAPVLYDEFRLHGLSGYFEKYFISSEVSAYKPHDLFAEALRQVGDLMPESTLFVGDSEVDILTGQKLVVRTVLKGKAQITAKSDYTVDTLTDVAEIIEKLY